MHSILARNSAGLQMSWGYVFSFAFTVAWRRAPQIMACSERGERVFLIKEPEEACPDEDRDSACPFVLRYAEPVSTSPVLYDGFLPARFG